MESSFELQKQIKENAEDLRRFVSDLSSWEEEMKRKDVKADETSSKETSVPPIRNASKKRDNGGDGTTSGDFQGVKKRISSSDYAAWEKFDVEKACEDVDKASNIHETESEEERQVREKRLRDEANVEKEKGNLFVKKEKWDNAIECYSRAIKCHSRDPIFYCNRALCFLKKKDYRAAETDCTSALSLDSTYVKALHRRGLARKELNQLDEAAADLVRASEIEPNNTAVMRDLNAVRLKIGERNLNTILVTETLETEAEVIVDLNVEKKSDPILPAKKHRPSTCTSKEPTDKKDANSCSSWPQLDNYAVVEPACIPAHKRSKRPLQRIQILEGAEIYRVSTKREAKLSEEKAGDTYGNVKQASSQDHVEPRKTEESSCSKNSTQSMKPTEKSDNQSKNAASSSISYVQTNAVIDTIPPIPRNSVQFLAGWRQINTDEHMSYNYLKKINGEDFPKIFQDSLDGNVLSQILNILKSKFIGANEPVLTYLQGITKVRRFRTLTLFLSKADKKNLEALLEHTQNLEKSSSDVITALKKEYEL